MLWPMPQPGLLYAVQPVLRQRSNRWWRRSSRQGAGAWLWMLTRVLAQELWPDNIRVNELIPGPVAAALTADLVNKPKGTVFSVDSEWIKQPEDVVPLALFLATQPPQGPTAQSYSLMRRDN